MTKAKKQTTQPQHEDTRKVMSKDGVPLARVRRTPSVLAFLITGFGLGAAAGLMVSIFGGEGGNYTENSSFGYFVALFGFLGLLLGGIAFAIVDKRAYKD